MAEGFLTQLRRVNTERYVAWTEGADPGIMFDALELGGEVGELLNVVKKLDREQRGWRGARARLGGFAEECADVLICLDKLARRLNVDLEAVTIAKFNATSDKVGLPHRLAATPRAAAAQPATSQDLGDRDALGSTAFELLALGYAKATAWHQHGIAWDHLERISQDELIEEARAALACAKNQNS